MFKQIVNKNGNTYFEYDFQGRPFQYVEVRHIPKDISIARREAVLGETRDRRRLIKAWAENVLLEYHFPKTVAERVRQTGVLPTGYQMHHVHPIAVGGYPTDIRNIVAIPDKMHDRLHMFLRDYLVSASLPITNISQSIPEGRKVFLALPKLPPVVTMVDVPYIKNTMDIEQDTQKAHRLIDEYLAKYPTALYRPRFMQQIDGIKSQKHYVWPVPRTERINPHQIHHTQSRAVLKYETKWDFKEWLANQRA